MSLFASHAHSARSSSGSAPGSISLTTLPSKQSTAPSRREIATSEPRSLRPDALSRNPACPCRASAAFRGRPRPKTSEERWRGLRERNAAPIRRWRLPSAWPGRPRVEMQDLVQRVGLDELELSLPRIPRDSLRYRPEASARVRRVENAFGQRSANALVAVWNPWRRSTPLPLACSPHFQSKKGLLKGGSFHNCSYVNEVISDGWFGVRGRTSELGRSKVLIGETADEIVHVRSAGSL
jgi:hypothetical protein